MTSRMRWSATRPAFCRTGGFAHILVSWIHARDNDDWQAPLRALVAESAADQCDAWLFRKGSYDPLAYAVMWNQRLAMANQMPKYVAAVDRWTRYFQHLGVPALGYGAVWLRRRDRRDRGCALTSCPSRRWVRTRPTSWCGCSR